MPAPGIEATVTKSTANRIRCFGSRMTIELSEWLRPT